jgi:hypothetical protein
VGDEEELVDLMRPAAEKLKQFLGKYPGTAVVHFEPFDTSDMTYWASEITKRGFERRAAREALKHGLTRWAFATSMIMADTPDMIEMRSPNPNFPPREQIEGEEYGEFMIIWIVAVDLSHGVEYGRIDIEPGTPPTYGELLVLQGETQMQEGAPGYELIRRVAEAE